MYRVKIQMPTFYCSSEEPTMAHIAIAATLTVVERPYDKAIFLCFSLGVRLRHPRRSRALPYQADHNDSSVRRWRTH